MRRRTESKNRERTLICSRSSGVTSSVMPSTLLLATSGPDGETLEITEPMERALWVHDIIQRKMMLPCTRTRLEPHATFSTNAVPAKRIERHTQQPLEQYHRQTIYIYVYIYIYDVPNIRRESLRTLLAADDDDEWIELCGLHPAWQKHSRWQKTKFCVGGS